MTKGTVLQRWRLLLLSAPMFAFLLIPVVALLLQADPPTIAVSITSHEALQAISLSLSTTLLTTCLTILLGTPVAYALARLNFRGKAALDTLIDLPIILPPAVAGIAMLMAFGRRGLLGGVLGPLGIELPFTQAAVVLAQLFVASPFYIKSASAGFANVDEDLEKAAAIDGASPMQVFRRITLPLSSRALIGGAVMTWARALGEFGATIIFAGNFPGRTQTMPLAIYIGFEIDLKVALALALVLLLTSFTVLAAVKGVLRQKLTVF